MVPTYCCLASGEVAAAVVGGMVANDVVSTGMDISDPVGAAGGVAVREEREH
jgi:hypothetical protein